MKEHFFVSTDNFEKIIKENAKNIKEVKQIHSAWTNFVFLVSTEQEKLIFRFPRNKFFSKALKKEIEISNYLFSKPNMQVNQLVEKKYKGRIYSIHEYIEGASLTEIYELFSLSEKKQFCQDIIEEIKKIQEIKVEKIFPKLSDFLQGLTNLSKSTNLVQIDFTKLKQLEKEKLVLCHGDLNPGNIIMKDNKVNSIIDFAFAGVSSQLLDLSRLIGRLPNEYYNILIDEFEKKFHLIVNLSDLHYLLDLWGKIEKNYVEYMKVNCKDIILPKFYF